MISPTGKEATRPSLFVAALSASQSDSNTRPHSWASISLAQTVSSTCRSLASSAWIRAANSWPILPLELPGSTGMEESRLDETTHSAAPMNTKPNRMTAKKSFFERTSRMEDWPFQPAAGARNPAVPDRSTGCSHPGNAVVAEGRGRISTSRAEERLLTRAETDGNALALGDHGFTVILAQLKWRRAAST